MNPAHFGTVLQHLRRLVPAPATEPLRDEQLLECFLTRRDEAAFEALVRRHGPMVFSVCRGVLHDLHDAEDAFQATFLALVKKAHSIRTRTSLGGWLHEVAHHLAVKARASAERRKVRENRPPAAPLDDPLAQMTLRELQDLLHEELARLPEKYRAPLVLCHLEGQSHEEAARQLGWSRRTVKGRLQRGRQRLRVRLTRRGLVLPAGLFTTALSVRPASANLSATLVGATIRAALSSSGRGLGAPGGTAALAQEATRRGASNLTVAGILLAFAVGLVGVGALWQGPAGAQSSGPPAKVATPLPKRTHRPEEKAPPKEREDTVPVKGVVLGPDGKPFKGAEIYVIHNEAEKLEPIVRAKSGPDGRFAFGFRKKDANESHANWAGAPWRHLTVMAAAEGFGPDWTQLSATDNGKALTFRLVKDDVPIKGVVRDLQGKPVAGASVWVAYVKTAGDNVLIQHGWAGYRSAATDKEGRFTIRGIGRDRTATLRVAGPTIEYKSDLPVETKPAIIDGKPADHAFLEVIALPAKPIEGVVRARDTGKPLAGVEVAARLTNTNLIMYQYAATTDKDGRYRIPSAPKSAEYEVQARPAPGQPYLRLTKRVGGTEGLKPIRLDFALRRGVPVRFRLIDKVTRKPVHGIVQYDLVRSNPLWDEACAPFSSNLLSSMEFFEGHVPDKDLTFHMVVYPGTSVLLARVEYYGPRVYLKVRLDPADAAKGYLPGNKGDAINFFFPSSNAYYRLNDARPDKPLTFDLFVDPGRTLRGKLLGPDGKPVSGAVGYGLRWNQVPNAESRRVDDTLTGSSFEASTLDPLQTYTLSFIHKQRKLIGHAVVRGDAKGPLTVRLQRWGTLTGRLVDDTGKRLAGVRVGLKYPALPEPGARPPDREFHSDAEGRFRVEGLLPGLKHELTLGSDGKAKTTVQAGDPLKNLVVRSGEVKDLGEVRVKVMPVK